MVGICICGIEGMEGRTGMETLRIVQPVGKVGMLGMGVARRSPQKATSSSSIGVGWSSIGWSVSSMIADESAARCWLVDSVSLRPRGGECGGVGSGGGYGDVIGSGERDMSPPSRVWRDAGGDGCAGIGWCRICEPEIRAMLPPAASAGATSARGSGEPAVVGC